MKSYEDMARDVLSRINEYEAERKRKRAKNTKIIASVTPVCAAAVIGIFVLKSGLSVPTHEQGSNILTEVSGTEQTTSADSTSVGKAVETSTSEAVASASKTTQSNLTETNTVNTTENSETNENSEINTTETENNDVDMTSSKNQPVNIDKPAETEITFTEVQTTVTVHENTTVISQNTTEIDFGGSHNNDGGNSDNGGGGDRLGTVTINGIFYMQTTTDTTIYTPDIYLGNGGDFKGYYQGDTSIRFYTAKENDEIVIVVFYDGSQLNLEKAAIDIE